MPTGTSDIPRELVLVRQVEKTPTGFPAPRNFGTDIASDKDEDDSEDDASENNDDNEGGLHLSDVGQEDGDYTNY